MANTMIENGMEVPAAPLGAGNGLKPWSVLSPSNTDIQSSHTRSLNIPNFDESGYETWILGRLVAERMVAYEAKIGKVTNPMLRNALTTVIEMAVRNEFFLNNETHVVWEGHKKKKSVSFFKDVPYKHSERTGEVFEGPVTSQLTFEKDRGEGAMLFVNAKPSE